MALTDPTITPSASGPAASPVGHPGRLQEDSLSLWSSIVVAMASVAPTLSVAVTMTAILAVSGYATPIVILILTLPMLGIAIAYRRLNLTDPNCGATYVWAARAISPEVGFMLGWIMVLAYILAVLSGVMAVGPYIVQIFVSNPAGLQVIEAIGASLVIVFITFTAYRGIDLTARVQWALVGIEYFALAVLAVLALVAVFGGHHGSLSFSWHWFSPSQVGSLSGFVAAALIVVFLFSGWDTAINLNEETKAPRVNPGNAVVTAVIFAGVLFAFLIFALQGVVSSAKLQANGSNALAYLGQVLAGGWLSKLMVVAVVLSATGGALASLLTGTRVAFAMAADSVLPQIFGRTHARFKTPTTATIVLGVMCLVLAWPYLLGASSVVSSFSTVVSSDGLLFAVFYAGTAFTMVVYFRRLAFASLRSAVELLVLPLASGLFLLYMAFKSVGNLGGWGGSTLVSLYGMLAVGLALLVYYRMRGGSAYFRIRRSVYEPPDEDAATTGEPAVVEPTDTP